MQKYRNTPIHQYRDRERKHHGKKYPFPVHTLAVHPVHILTVHPVHILAVHPVHTLAVHPVHTLAVHHVHTLAVNPEESCSYTAYCSVRDGHLF